MWMRSGTANPSSPLWAAGKSRLSQWLSGTAAKPSSPLWTAGVRSDLLRRWMMAASAGALSSSRVRNSEVSDVSAWAS